MYWLYWHQALGKSFQCFLVYVHLLLHTLCDIDHMLITSTQLSAPRPLCHTSVCHNLDFNTNTKSGKSQFKKNIHVSVEGSLSFKSTCFNLFSVLIFRCFSSSVEKNRNSNLLLFTHSRSDLSVFLNAIRPCPLKR